MCKKGAPVAGQLPGLHNSCMPAKHHSPVQLVSERRRFRMLLHITQILPDRMGFNC